jgi:hypothetical protein
MYIFVTSWGIGWLEHVPLEIQLSQRENDIGRAEAFEHHGYANQRRRDFALKWTRQQ